MATAKDWMKAKWAALSRLPADTPTPLPFMDEHSRAKLDTALPAYSQEAKMLRANADGRPSDTNALNPHEQP
jgi:hypothetical protein